MKNLILTSFLILGLWGGKVSAQQANSTEYFGNTLNLGFGLGYYGYVGHFMPVVNLNYEFQLANNFTLAPFVTVYSLRDKRKWENQDYYYRHTVIPMGVKGTYYFDKLFGLNSRWDVYGAGSVGFVLRTTYWDKDYNGDFGVYGSRSPLYLDAHIGAEYHVNSKLGVYLDLSTGLSTFGFAFHL